MKNVVISVLAAAACATGSSGASASPPAAQPGIVLQRPGVYSFMVGDVRVTALSDGTVPLDLHLLLRGTTPARTDALLARGFLSNPVEASINAYLLEIGTRRVLVDTGAGDLFGPGNGGRLLESLAAAGVRPDQIDDILLTHVHTDHSGGLDRGGRLIFPNATVHAGQPDIDFFLDRSNAARTGYDARYFTEATTTVKPYLDAGKLRGFDRPTTIMPGVTAELHPGHTPGSAFYTVESRGRRIVFVGDIVHAGAVQLPAPDVTITFDFDQATARKVRMRAFANFADARTLIAAPHLPFPGVGHVRRSASEYQWVPLEYGDRDIKLPAVELRRGQPVRPAP